MTIPELQPEIWAHIFRFLFRPPPPAWLPAEWEDLHQHDLTTVSRLSSTHHELAVPILYTSIVIDGLPSLLAHLDDASPSLITKITSKRDRLALTRHIRIAAAPPPYDAWTFQKLLSGDASWTCVGETSRSRTKRWYKQARTTLEGIRQVLPDFRNGAKAPLRTPRLDSIVIARDANGTWRDIFSPRASNLSLPIPDGLTQLSVFNRAWVADFLFTLNPRILCSHRCEGPYDPWSMEVPEGNKMVMACSHFHGSFGVTLPLMMGATTNRYYLEPAYLPDDIYDPMREEGMQAVFGSLEEITDRRVIDRTTIELLGLLTSSRTLEMNTTSPDPGLDGYRASKRGECAVGEGQAVKQLLSHLRGELKPVWRDKVDIGIWDEIPKCEGCGWTNSDIY